ncbi:MAG: hypothetical protein K0R71_827 [Bacillales bacterium]|jgi:hypothetical protein|nr:hypothetical protein [Bacillales bacterium]
MKELEGLSRRTNSELEILRIKENWRDIESESNKKSAIKVADFYLNIY